METFEDKGEPVEQIIGVFDDEININCGKVLYVDAAKQIFPVPSNILHEAGFLHNSQEKITNLQNLYETGQLCVYTYEPLRGSQEKISTNTKERIQRTLSSLPPTYPREKILNLFTVQPLTYVMLIDSDGGCTRTLKYLNAFSRSVQKRQGNVHAFVGLRAASAAASLLSEVKTKPKMFYESRIHMHYSRINETPTDDWLESLIDKDSVLADIAKREERDRHQAEYEEMIEYFTARLQPEHAEKCISIIKIQLESRRELVVQARDLAKLGIADIFGAKKLYEQFLVLTGLSKDQAKETETLYDFFKKSYEYELDEFEKKFASE